MHRLANNKPQRDIGEWWTIFLQRMKKCAIYCPQTVRCVREFYDASLHCSATRMPWTLCSNAIEAKMRTRVCVADLACVQYRSMGSRGYSRQSMESPRSFTFEKKTSGDQVRKFSSMFLFRSISSKNKAISRSEPVCIDVFLTGLQHTKIQEKCWLPWLRPSS